ncbi:BolA protein [Methylohalomonas lacus]|uniref:BolA protein n=1 Tax=Methylohalomonas lacus TaxID=398773 RepID=A0AAE3L1A3_9GAMM|nr:BolA family protein [Methylohalomonas lacus]MCS3902891.1 BolA protein [Methylohalomonas lacus]
MDRVATIRERLQAALQPTHIDIADESHKHARHAGARESGGGHFNVTIVAECFRDQSPIKRHRMVYAAVEDLMPQEIHALSIRALTADEQ